MSFTLFSVAIIAVLITVICLQMHKGYKRGLSYMLINLAVIACSALGGVAVSGMIADSFEPLLNDYIKTSDFYVELVQTMPNLSLVVVSAALMVVSLLLYVPVFFIIRILLSLLVWTDASCVM